MGFYRYNNSNCIVCNNYNVRIMLSLYNNNNSKFLVQKDYAKR